MNREEIGIYIITIPESLSDYDLKLFLKFIIKYKSPARFDLLPSKFLPKDIISLRISYLEIHLFKNHPEKGWEFFKYMDVEPQVFKNGKDWWYETNT